MRKQIQAKYKGDSKSHIKHDYTNNCLIEFGSLPCITPVSEIWPEPKVNNTAYSSKYKSDVSNS